MPTTENMRMNTQKEAVFNAATSIIGAEFKEGMDAGAWFKSRPEQKKQLQAAMLEGVGSEFEVKNEQENMGVYITGLIANHLRKDTRLNGGEKYTPANPGSRAGQGDPEIKASRQLLKTLVEDSPEYNKVKAFITSKIAANKAAKQTVEIDVDALPAELQSLVG